MPTINGKGQATIFSRNELIKFFKVAKQHDFYWYCLFKFLYYTGERSGCVLQVKWSDIDLDCDVISFRAETRKQKTNRKPIPIHPELKQVLMQYKPNHHEKVNALLSRMNKRHSIIDIDISDILFLSPRNPTHLFRTSLDEKFRKLLLECGYENKGFSLHSFRRTFITRLYEINKNIKECMAITGHKSMNGFMVYVDITENSIVETINSL